MSSSFDFDEIFGDLSRMMRRLRGPDELERAIREGKLRGNWDVEEIDEPDVKGYVIRGSFQSEQPLPPLEPFEPPIRRRRPPTPERLELPDGTLNEISEPLVDVFEGENEVKVYIELPREGAGDVQLNVTEGGVEVKAKGFYRLIKVPADTDIEKASSKHRNRVLEVTIPKRRKSQEGEAQRITIE